MASQSREATESETQPRPSVEDEEPISERLKRLRNRKRDITQLHEEKKLLAEIASKEREISILDQAIRTLSRDTTRASDGEPPTRRQRLEDAP